MRKNLTTIFAILVVFILMNTPASASRTEFDTEQVCNIEGTIQSVKFEEAYRDPCLDDNSCPVGAYNPKRPETHYLKILLSSVTCEPDRSNIPYSYQSQFPLEEEVEIYVNENRISKSQIENDLPFEPGQKIRGQVEYFFGHAFTSYEIESSLEVYQLELVDSDPRVMTANVTRIILGFLGIVAIILTIIGSMGWGITAKRKYKLIMLAGIILLFVVFAAFGITSYYVELSFSGRR